jgi:hypothetical protein
VGVQRIELIKMAGGAGTEDPESQQHVLLSLPSLSATMNVSQISTMSRHIGTTWHTNLAMD